MEISIITATLNSIRTLPNLVKSLKEQSDKNFEWVVADGLSTDGTFEFLNSIEDLSVRVSRERDCGIYDALNRGIRMAVGKYYLVLGSDDILFPDAIKHYRSLINTSQPGIIAVGLIAGNRKVYPKKKFGWLYGMAGISSSHSVGMMIRKDLHDTYGFYSKDLAITADQLFVKTVIAKKELVVRDNFLAGKMAADGFSSTNALRFQMEFFISQWKTERFKFLQIILLVLRLIKNYRRL